MNLILDRERDVSSTEHIVSNLSFNSTNNTGIILIFPESICLGIEKEIMALYQEKGIKFLTISIIDRITDHQLFKLSNLDNNLISTENPYWLNKLKLSIGPNIAFLVTSAKKNNDINEIFNSVNKEIKIKFSPINKAMNLSSNTINISPLLQEKDLFFKENILNISNNILSTFSYETIHNLFLSGYSSYQEKYTSFYEVLYHVLHRLYTHLAFNLFGHKTKQLDILRDYIIAGIKKSTANPENHSVQKSIFESLKTHYEIDLFEDLELKDNFVAENIIRIMNSLIYFSEEKNTDWLKILNELELTGVKISTWEKLILLTSFYSQ